MSISVVPARSSDVTSKRRKRWRLRFVRLGLLVLLAGGAWKTIATARVRLEVGWARDDLRSCQPLEAAERLQRVLAHLPNSAEAEFLLAVAKRRAGYLAEVEPHLLRAEELGWDPKAIERQRFLSQFQAGDFQRAGPYVKRLFDQGGNDDEAEEVCEAMIRGYFAGLLFREARMIVKHWTQWQPNNPQPYLLRADDAVLMSEGSSEVEAYREILRFAPDHYETRLRLAQALIEQHYFDEAFDLLKGCTHEKPKDGVALIALASCLEQQGRLEESQRKIEAALKLPLADAQRALALEVEARVATALRDHAKAARLLEEVVGLAPGNKAYAYQFAQALQHAGRRDEGTVAMRKWEELRQIDARLDDIRDALLTTPDDPDLRCEVGKLNLKKGGHEILGVNWLLSAVIRDPGHRAANEALADYYRSVGQADLAERHLAAIGSPRGAMPAVQAIPVVRSQAKP